MWPISSPNSTCRSRSRIIAGSWPCCAISTPERRSAEGVREAPDRNYRTGTNGRAPTGQAGSSHEVLGRRVVADNGVGGLLGVQLESLADGDPDAGAPQQLHHLGVVVEVRAGRVAPRVAPAPVGLAEEAGQRRPVLVAKPEFLADPAVPVLRGRFGHLDAEAVQAQVAEVLVVGKETCGLLRGSGPDGAQHEAGEVLGPCSRVAGTEEVGDAEPGFLALPREGEAHPLRCARLVLPDDQVVAL